MGNEIIFTVEYQGQSIDISVDSKIKSSDLINILSAKFDVQDMSAKLYSKNHKRPLRPEQTLFDEKIWDGDILSIIK